MSRRVLSLLPLVLIATLVGSAGAQSTRSLRDHISDLFTFGDCGQPLCLDLPGAHGNHFLPSLAKGNSTVISFLGDAIGKASSSVPVGATSSGATFTFVGGLPVKTSTSAGPIFGERSQTLGRGRFFLGANVTAIKYTTLNGIPLSALSLNFNHEDVDPVGAYGDPQFENDLIALTLDLDVDVFVGTVAFTYGLTDFIDVGVSIPMVRTSIKGQSAAQILPFGPTALHHFAGTDTDPVLRAAASLDATATGIGDVVARAKINLGQSNRVGAALLAEGRFATGDDENLLGSGASQIRILGIAAAQFGTFSPHLNAGYVVRSGEFQNDAIVATLGFDNLMTDWSTLAVGLVSEFQMGESDFSLPGPIVYDTPFSRQVPATVIPNRKENLLSATVGTKFTLRGGSVLTTNALFPLRKAGLQPDFLWTMGLEFSF
jgi:hypothetical protein